MEMMTAEEFSSILESDLPIEENQKKIEDTKANTKKDKDRDAKSERNIVNEANATPNANSNANEKAKELVDPLTAEEISSISDSKLTSKEKSSLLMESNLCSTPSTVELKEEVQHVETKSKEDNHDELRTHGISKVTNESLSQAKEEVPLDLKSTSDEKSSSIACNRNNGGDIPSSKVNTSSISSRLIELQALAEDRPRFLELKEHTLAIAKEIKELQSNPESGAEDTLYREEAVCKECFEPLFDENNNPQPNDVQKAKCKCRQLALIHANCAEKWKQIKGSRCLACVEQIEYRPVTLAIVTYSRSSPQKTKKGNLGSLICDSMRSYWCCFCR